MSAPTLRGICAASVFFGLALTLLPEGRERRAASLCVTAALVMMLLSASDAFAADAERKGRELSRLVIERECGEYIMDKAAELSLAVNRVKVSARWSREGVWVPERAEIVLDRDGESRKKLASLIAAELGIPEDRQEWSVEGNA